MLLQCDASQLEWRTILQLSGDKVGIQEVCEGEDTHAKNQEAFVLPSRLIAKIFLFRTIFRGSGWSFANDPDFMHVSTSATFWDEMNEKFYSKYRGIDKCHHEWAKTVAARKPIVGPFGRSWLVDMGDKIPWTTLSNYPVQGTGADIMMLARISAYNRIKRAQIPCDFISTVHDSIVVDCLSRYRDDISQIFHSVFADLAGNIRKLYGYDWIVPMACECKYGPDMKNMSKIA